MRAVCRGGMAKGEDTLLRPLKPVGLTDPRNGTENYAVCSYAGTMRRHSDNLVGFQTHPSLENKKGVHGYPDWNAEFVRYGVSTETHISIP